MEDMGDSGRKSEKFIGCSCGSLKVMSSERNMDYRGLACKVSEQSKDSS